MGRTNWCSDDLKQQVRASLMTDLKTLLLELCGQPVNEAKVFYLSDPDVELYMCFYRQPHSCSQPVFYMGHNGDLSPMRLHVTQEEILSDENTLDVVHRSMISKVVDLGWTGGPVYPIPGTVNLIPRVNLFPPLGESLMRAIRSVGFPPVRGQVDNLEQVLAKLPETPVPGLAAACERYIRAWGSGGGALSVEESIYDACTTDDPRELARRTYAAAKLVTADADEARGLICCMMEEALPEAPRYADDRREAPHES